MPAAWQQNNVQKERWNVPMRKRASKFLSLFLVLAMACALYGGAMAAESVPDAGTDLSGKLVILHTNDTHGADVASETSIGTAGVAQLKKDYEAAGAEVLLLSAGDAIQGAPIVNYDHGASEIAFMNAAGYDAMSLGNHEFDWGYENLVNITASAEFPIICANVVDKESGEPVFEPNHIFETESGLKVGVFGLETPETATKTNPKNIETITFLGLEDHQDLYDCAQEQVDALTEAGADLIVCLGHLGINDESAGMQSIDVVNNVTGIDLFIDAHSHSTNAEIAEKAGGSNVLNDTLIVSTGTKLANVGVVTYDPEADTLDYGYVVAGEYTSVDETVNTLINNRDAEVSAALAEIIGTTEVTLDGERDPGVRTQETNLGDFATDALLWAARQELGEDAVDAAFTNGGGIRDTIHAGDISLEIMTTVFPYGNTVATVDITGAQLLEMLEANTFSLPDAIGGFPQVSGITYTVDTSVPYENGELYPGTTYYAPANPGARVKDVTVNGEPLDLEATYTVATNDFTAVGGDAYYVLTQGENLVITAISMEEALANYAQEVLGGTITAEQYGESAGRITVLYADADFTDWYGEAARYVIGEGLMSTTDGSSFTPTGTVTRATVYQTLYNMEGQPEAVASVTDAEGMWYADAVNWAAEAGLLEGTEFGTDAPITRAEIAGIIADYAAYKEITVDTSGTAMQEAPDYADIPDDALEGMTFCYYADIMVGDQAGNLNPGSQLTRAEFAQVLMNFDKLVQQSQTSEAAA